LTSLKIFK